MADICAFPGIRYGAEHVSGGDISSLICPPYDVLGQADKDRLSARNPHNIVRIDLPFAPAKQAGPDAGYEQSASILKSWLAQGVLVVDKIPALTVCQQKFEWEGSEYTRRLFLCRLRLEPFGQGSVFPHEHTFGGPKEDRLKLMKATACQTSPIFSLFADSENEVFGALEPGLGVDPDSQAMTEGVGTLLYSVTDAGVIEAIREAMRDREVYVADGHHRYLTALTYRDWVAEREGGLTEDHPSNFVLTALGVMDDPGMLILPTHRVLMGLGEVGDAQLLEAWSTGLEIRPADGPDPQADFNLVSGRSSKRWSARIKGRGVLRKLEPAESEAWCGLDMAYLHRYLIDELLVAGLRGGKALTIRYLKSERDAESAAKDEGGMAILVRATTMGQLRAVSEAGGLMPQKSTFFYPKLATGMVINPLSGSAC